MRLFPTNDNCILPLLKELGFDSPVNDDRELIITAIKNYEVTLSDVQKEIEDYVNNFDTSYDKYEVISDAVKIYKKLTLAKPNYKTKTIGED